MAKGRSSIQQKVVAARKRMYTPQQAAAYEPCECDPKLPPMGDDFDKKLKGGYKTGINNRCAVHSMVLTKNGKCIECELDE